MEAKKCKYCGRGIPSDKRADSKFCSNSCKASHWEENKHNKQAPKVKPMPEPEQPKITDKPLDGLRGVIENKPAIDVSDVKETSVQQENRQAALLEIKEETTQYRSALGEKEKAEADYLRVKKTLTGCETGLQAWLKEEEQLKYAKPAKRYKVTNTDIEDLEDTFWDEIEQSDKLHQRKKEVQEKIALFTDNKSKLEKMLPTAKKIYDEAALKLKCTVQYEPVKQNTNIFASALSKILQKGQPQPELSKPKEAEEQPAPNPVTIQSNSKLISSRELREMNYKCLNFQGRWKEFFGLPAVVFHLAVHGKPGEGKSTFCIQFADYLAKHFGNVVYISGEEGFSKTLRDKVVNNKIDNPNLFFADISSFEQIRDEIERKFHFIFIDSLDTLRIDAARLRELKEHYPQSAFITISQSTKDGKMRGSQEIIHDTDIAVKVEDGIAITTKNRYHPRGTEFKVFPAVPKLTNTITDEPAKLM